MAIYSRQKIRAWILVALFVVLGVVIVSANNSTLTKYALCDIRVMYITDNEASIDWPTLYYFNDNYGCRVDVVLIRQRAAYRVDIREVPEREIFYHRYGIPAGTPGYLDSCITTLFQKRYPDIILFGSGMSSPTASAFRKKILSIEPSSVRWFHVLRYYEKADRMTSSMDTEQNGFVVINSNEFAQRYKERLRHELPELGIEYGSVGIMATPLVHYRLITEQSLRSHTGGDFIQGIPLLRLLDILDALLPDTPKKMTMVRQAKQFISSFQKAEHTVGKKHADLMLKGYRALVDLKKALSGDTVLQEREDLTSYFFGLVSRAEQATLQAVGISWNGKVVLRDSSHGPKLKFRASLAADGPEEVRLQALKFIPYWDTTVVYIDSVPRIITPHQAFIREYLVDIDKQYFETNKPESLVFAAEIGYGELSLTAYNTLPLWEKPTLTAQFEPDFYFIPPIADLDVDRVVATTTMRVVITKPLRFAGDVKLNLRTPRGLFAGAYLKELTLEQGKTFEAIRVPFSISKLFELGVQQLTAELLYQGRVASVDTALVRVASCKIADTIKIGFLPDTTGLLEDILSMTDAAYRPLTNRGLLTADLDAYNVIIIGSGTFQSYPSLRKVKDRFETYIRNGGSLVIFGQPESWPEGILPVSFIPTMELVDKSGITNRIKQAHILSSPYKISETNLLSSFYKPREVISAVVAPSEKVFVTPSDGTLLSVTRIGDGQLIYCGLPLLELISSLDIDAIHLFANIMNY